jgi:hypothetical protein
VLRPSSPEEARKARRDLAVAAAEEGAKEFIRNHTRYSRIHAKRGAKAADDRDPGDKIDYGQLIKGARWPRCRSHQCDKPSSRKWR